MPLSQTTTSRFEQIVCGQIPAYALGDNELIEMITRFNELYREGKPTISDHRYDQEFLGELARRQPDHPLLHRVEPENTETFGGKRVRLVVPMLSLDKAYTDNEIERFIDRVRAAALQSGMAEESISLRATTKLDGQSGQYDGRTLTTRGDGNYGNDITEALSRGVVVVGEAPCTGEIVVHKPYFESVLSDDFEHPRNFIVGALGAKELSEISKTALKANVVRFVSYSTLPAWHGTPESFLRMRDEIIGNLKSNIEYAIDGIVLEVMNTEIRNRLGSTNHHPRYAIAIKEKGETADTVVVMVTYQTGRTGRVTPVLEVSPVRVSGATISRLTAHHASMVRKQGLGIGAKIRIIRSGEVIPYIDAVLQPAESSDLPQNCPSCGHDLEWEGDKFLTCPNTLGCPAQIENSIRHFFSTLGTADLFGPKNVERLVAGGYDTIENIYAMRNVDFVALGFGDVQADNFVRELKRSRTEEVEDWRFLAAFGINHLGRGDSRKLVQHIPLTDLGREVTAERISAIHGFGDLTGPAIASQLAQRWGIIRHMLDLGFNLRRTPLLSESAAQSSPIAGKGIVFTGVMVSGSREDMEAHARTLGANVQSSVNRKTSYLICGDKVGEGKTNKARELGVATLTEYEYLDMIKPLSYSQP